MYQLLIASFVFTVPNVFAAHIKFVVPPHDVWAGETQSVTLSVVDDNEDLVVQGSDANGPVQIEIVGPSGPKDHVSVTLMNGVGSATLTLTESGPNLVSARLENARATFVSVNVGVGEPSAATSAIELEDATGTALFADNRTDYTVRIRICDSYGNGVPNSVVHFESSDDTDVIDQPSARTDHKGETHGTIRSSRPGRHLLTLTEPNPGGPVWQGVMFMPPP